MPRIFIYVSHKDGAVDDSFAELMSAAKRLDSSAAPTAVLTGSGSQLDAACESLRVSFAEVWKISKDSLSYPNAELVRRALVQVLPPASIILLPHNHFGMDLAPGLSIKLNAFYVSDVTGIKGIDGEWLKLVRQEFGGIVSTNVRCAMDTGVVLTLRPGAFKPIETPTANGTVIDKSSALGELTSHRRYVETIAPPTTGVDITKEAILVSIGRGIQEKDNVAIAEELAKVLGAAVSCSRPVVDAKWLEKSRQVGSSGQTVRPKVYLACGISGSFQHLAGLKGNPFIIAINKNPKAPIFQVADVGVVADILEFLPELTNRFRTMKKGVAA